MTVESDVKSIMIMITVKHAKRDNSGSSNAHIQLNLFLIKKKKTKIQDKFNSKNVFQN